MSVAGETIQYLKNLVGSAVAGVSTWSLDLQVEKIAGSDDSIAAVYVSFLGTLYF
jgi:phage gp37-like protein